MNNIFLESKLGQKVGEGYYYTKSYKETKRPGGIIEISGKYYLIIWEYKFYDVYEMEDEKTVIRKHTVGISDYRYVYDKNGEVVSCYDIIRIDDKEYVLKVKGNKNLKTERNTKRKVEVYEYND